MKPFLLLITAISITVTAQAQIQWGVKAGLNLSNIHRTSPIPEVDYNLKPGLLAGVFVYTLLARHFALETELLYSQQGTKANTNLSHSAVRLQYLALPVLMQYAITRRLFVDLGAQAGYLLAAKNKVNAVFWASGDPGIDAIKPGDKVDVKNRFKSLDISGVAGAGFYPGSNWRTGVRYTMGFSGITKKGFTIDQSRYTNNVFHAYLSYSFHVNHKKS